MYTRSKGNGFKKFDVNFLELALKKGKVVSFPQGKDALFLARKYQKHKALEFEDPECFARFENYFLKHDNLNKRN